MREAREAASLGNAGTPATSLSPAANALGATAKAEPDTKPGEQSQESIEAAINAVIRLPQRAPGAAPMPGGEITPLSQSLPTRRPGAAPMPGGEITPLSQSLPTPEPTPEPVAVEPVAVEPVAVEPVAVEPVAVEPVAEPVAVPAPEPVLAAPLAVEVPEPVSPIPAPAASFHILDSQAPMPELVDEDTTIFAAMRSNWFTAGGDIQQPWSGNEVDAGWEAADRVAEAAPLQVSEAGLPVRRPGSRIVPGGVKPAAATLVRDPEAIRARLAAHADGVNRARRVVGGPDHGLDVDADHSTHDSLTQKEVDPA
jgi:hypothetical protein